MAAPYSPPLTGGRPEDFDAEEPEVAELDALRGRQEGGQLEEP